MNTRDSSINQLMNRAAETLEQKFLTLEKWENLLQEFKDTFKPNIVWPFLKMLYLLARVGGHSEIVLQSAKNRYEQKAKDGDKEAASLYYNCAVMLDDVDLLAKFELVEAKVTCLDNPGISDEELRALGLDPAANRVTGGVRVNPSYWKFND